MAARFLPPAALPPLPFAATAGVDFLAWAGEGRMVADGCSDAGVGGCNALSLSLNPPPEPGVAPALGLPGVGGTPLPSWEPALVVLSLSFKLIVVIGDGVA